MAQMDALEDASSIDTKPGTSIAGPLRSRPCSSERDAQVRDVQAALQSQLGPYERLLTYLQSVLVWERPFQCVLLYLLVNVLFWFFALTSLRLLFLLASGLALLVCVDTWKNQIWPKFRAKSADEFESESLHGIRLCSWGLVQPGVLSVPELCHHVAEAWVSGLVLASSALQFKRHNPGKFCILTCSLFSCFATTGRYIPGLVLSYLTVLAMLLAPLVAYHRLFQRVLVKLDPVLQWLDFSGHGYMMSKPFDNQFLRLPLHSVLSREGSDSEEELAEFCPKFDDLIVTKELDLTDSEHSDAEISYTDNGTFNLSRGPTPLTEGSEDLDRHSDAEESFAQDLTDFPSINPDATLMDDDDDTSIGLPSHRASVLDVDAHLDSDQDDLDSEVSLSSLTTAPNFTGDLAGVIASNMIQAALVSAMQPRRPSAHRRQAPPRAGTHHRSHRKQSSSEMDTDLDTEDFEMLDQSELSQMDPLGEGAGRGQSQGSNFLSSLLGKQQ
ncbi:reticulophagy regulator 3 isoform X1 [Entelurus aequoreus]|uniref:reticulophagy regulator 3 isoform X1 n=1 Tax=Entelurus aequoreus TaxID=161455 RepID=UPI002B1DAD79|nr:reticulophagy regulator 3 isoform X1 [Entelurus aequoreus]